MNERNNTDGGGCLGAIIFVVVILTLLEVLITVFSKLVSAAVSVFTFILIAVGVIGSVLGVFFAFKSFFTAVFNVNTARKTANTTPLYRKGLSHKNEDGSLVYYEDIAPHSYFNGPMRKDVIGVLKGTWANIGEHLKLFITRMAESRGIIRKALSALMNVFSMLALLIFGSVVSAVLSAMVLAASIIIQLLYKVFYFAVLSAERISFASKKVTYRCDFCKEEYSFPVYFCPECGIAHKKLRPGEFGIFSRRCGCLYTLPATAHGKTADGVIRGELEAACPYCGHADNSGVSRQLGIPLIGGVNAGKTTFKTAFLYQFLNDEATLRQLDVKLPSKEAENEFEEIRSCFLGKRVVTETRPGREYDVTSFNFIIKNKRLDVPRQLHIYDMPGEVFEQSNAQERLKHFTFSEGVIFVIDPYSMQAVIDEGGGTGGMRVGTMDLNKLTEIFLETLEKLPDMPKDGKKYSIPVAVCINKADTPALRGRIGMPAADLLMREKPSVYTDRYDTMDMLCREFLKANGKSNAVTLLDQNFRNVHFFACSAMGYVPKGVLARFVPEQVLAAVYWIIARSDGQLGALLGDEIPHDVDEQTRRKWDSKDYFDIVEDSLIK
ncbi:MAG: hypothetical protein J6M17_03895 [Ruminococcus sp.]|nr:hypothetical protein [Ruminococcus sp.]